MSIIIYIEEWRGPNGTPLKRHLAGKLRASVLKLIIEKCAFAIANDEPPIIIVDPVPTGLPGLVDEALTSLGERRMSYEDVCRLLELSRLPSMTRREMEGHSGQDFPYPVEIDDKYAGWIASQVDAWVAQRQRTLGTKTNAMVP